MLELFVCVMPYVKHITIVYFEFLGVWESDLQRIAQSSFRGNNFS